MLAGATWAFIELADEIVEGGTAALDRTLLLALRSSADPAQPLGPAWLHELMRDFTALGGVGVLTLLTVSASGYLWLLGARRAAATLLLSVLLGVLASTLLKVAFDRPRPDLVPHGSYVRSASFPSGHSMMAAVVYLTLGALIARVHSQMRLRIYLLAISVLVTLLIGISRVYLGVHWPSDVLGGWAVGAAWALLCWLAMLWLQVHDRIPQPASTT